MITNLWWKILLKKRYALCKKKKKNLYTTSSVNVDILFKHGRQLYEANLLISSLDGLQLKK